MRAFLVCSLVTASLLAFATPSEAGRRHSSCSTGSCSAGGYSNLPLPASGICDSGGCATPSPAPSGPPTAAVPQQAYVAPAVAYVDPEPSRGRQRHSRRGWRR